MGAGHSAAGRIERTPKVLVVLASLFLLVFVPRLPYPALSPTVAGLGLPRLAGGTNVWTTTSALAQSLCGAWQACVRTAASAIKPVTALGACLGSVERAQRLADDERDSVAAERAAFETFAEAVASMPTTTASPSPSVRRTDGSGQSLAAVRERYRETVLAAPGYERAYDEDLSEHITAEFGRPVAGTVLADGRLTPPLKRVLVAGARESAAERTDLLGALDRERDSLATAVERLDRAGDVLSPTALEDRSFSELIDREGRLRAAERDCTDLLTDRQRRIHEERRRTGSLLQEYLYADLEPTYPVLDATVRQIDRLRDRRRAVTRAVTARV